MGEMDFKNFTLSNYFLQPETLRKSGSNNNNDVARYVYNKYAIFDYGNPRHPHLIRCTLKIYYKDKK